MPDRATKAKDALAKLVRATGKHPFARPVLVGAYELVASVGSGVLGKIPHAGAVYLSGSLLSPQSVAPGVSDVDLFVVAHLPTCEAELEFRAALRRRLRWLNVAGSVFYNLDYFDVTDVPFLLAFGNTWDQGISNEFRLLRGAALPRREFERSPHELPLERLVNLFGKWRRLGGKVLDPRSGVEPWVLVRTAERLLALAQGTDASRASAPALDGTDGDRARRCLATTLEVMERLSDERTKDWSGTWPVQASGAIPEPSAECWQDAKALRAAGFASVCVVPDGPAARSHRVIAVGAERESASMVVDRAESFFRRLASQPRARASERPLILTRRLWNAAALLDPIPFTGAHVACGGHRVLGEPLPPPNAPPSEVLKGLLRARTTELFYKVRGRQLRAAKPSAVARLSSDLRLMPALSAALDTGEIDLRLARGGFPDGEGAEAVVIAATREWISDRKDALRPELERRQKS